MPLLQQRRDSLLRFTTRLFDQLADVRPSSVRHLLSNALGGLGQRADVDHAHLFLLRRLRAGRQSASLVAQWSAGGQQLDRQRLQALDISLFGSEAVARLATGTIVYSAREETKAACSRLVSGILRELSAAAYEMYPVSLGAQWSGILAFAHDRGPMHLDVESRQVLQLAGKVLVSGLLSSRREVRRRSRHRQWKRIADGACDFAVTVTDSCEIMRVIPFRRKHTADLVGLRIEDVFDRSSAEHLTDAMRSAFATGIPTTLDVRTRSFEGRQESFAVRIEPPAESAADATASVPKSLTLYLTSNEREREHAEEIQQLRVALDRATRLSQLGNIATEFAHQLKQPLQSITAHAFTLRTRLNRAAARNQSLLSLVENIQSQVAHAGDVVTSVQGFMRDRHMKVEPVVLSRVIQHALLLVRPIADGQNVRLLTRDDAGLLAADPSTLIEADRVQTTHVLINLLMNAIEACSLTGRSDLQVVVSVDPGRQDRTVLVSVADNGPGIPLERIDSVFERFYTTKAEGFGIGLAICRDVIERQGGSISVFNNSGCGCTFAFTVNRWNEDESEFE